MHILAQFMQNPLERHWAVALCVVRYLKSCPGQGIFLSSSDPQTLAAYCNINCCPLTRHSLIGYFIFLGAFPIS